MKPKDWLVIKEEWVEGNKEDNGFEMNTIVFCGTLDECVVKVENEDDASVFDYEGNGAIHYYVHKDEAKLRGYTKDD